MIWLVVKTTTGRQVMADKQPSFRVNDDFAVTEIYANKIVSAAFDGHAVVITFGSGRILPERTDDQPKGGTTICVNCRVALSPPAALELINTINNLMTSVQKAQATKVAA
jgi:hypothetical protein